MCCLLLSVFDVRLISSSHYPINNGENVMFASFLSTAHDQCFQAVFVAHVMKFVSWRKNLCYRSGRFGCMLLLLLLGHMCKVRKQNAGVVSGRCMCFASAHPKCASRGRVYVWGVFRRQICQSACSQASNGLRKRFGGRVGRNPPLNSTKKIKRSVDLLQHVWVRESAVSPSHTTI